MASKAEKNFKKNAAEMFISSASQIPESEPQPATTEEDGDKYVTDIKVPAGYRLQREYKSDRLQLLIRPTTKKRIKQRAAALGISVNDLVNQILDEYTEGMVNE